MFSILIIILIVIMAGISSTLVMKRKETDTTAGFFSVSSMIEKLLLLIKRFPISILLVIGLAVLFFVAVNKNFDAVSYPLWVFFSVGALISATATLFLEDHFDYIKNYGITFFAVLLWGVYCVFLPEKVEDIYANKGIEVLVIGGTAFLAMLFISFLKKDKDRDFWNFSTQTLFQIALACIFGAILFGGLSLALLAIDSLFNVSINSKIYGKLAVICFVLFSPLYFLANIPYKTEKHNNEIFYNKVQKILALYILTPILTVYVFILYAYLFKIVFAWELPNGWVSWLVSALGLGGLIVITFLYPIRELEKNKITNFISRRFGLLILPLLMLMTIGISRRISDYGITINRGYIFLLNIWFYGIYIYLFFTRSRHIKWILISLAAVAFLTSIGSWSVANITKKSLTKEANSVLNKQVSVEEARVIFTNMTQKEKDRMKSTLEYLYKNFGKESVQPFFTDTVSGSYWNFLSKLDLKNTLAGDIELISYYASNKKTWNIEGYNTFAQVLSYYRSSPDDSSKKEQNIIDVSVDNRTFSIPIRKIALEYLATDEKLRNEKDLTIRGNDYLLLIKSFTGNYYPVKDSIFITKIEGYLFYNFTP